jgi:hypothetical protein
VSDFRELETPWITNEQMCGTKGMAVPLVGFAVRLKASAQASVSYDCEYSGYFKSGLTIGPMRNGAPCRSTVANDPLEGIQLHIARRAAIGQATPVKKVSAHLAKSVAVQRSSRSARPIQRLSSRRP